MEMPFPHLSVAPYVDILLNEFCRESLWFRLAVEGTHILAVMSSTPLLASLTLVQKHKESVMSGNWNFWTTLWVCLYFTEAGTYEKCQPKQGNFSLCSKMEMPRKPKVPLEDQIAVIKEFMEHFLTDAYPAYTSPIWQRMSDYLKGEWSAHNVYVNVRENRNEILSRARNELGLAVLDAHDKQAQRIDVPAINDTTSSNAEDLSYIEDETTNLGTNTDKKKTNREKQKTAEKLEDETWSLDENANKEPKGLEKIDTVEFELILTEKEWDCIKPEGTVLYGNRRKEILQRGSWTNVISIAFWKQHKTNCAFVYKRANVQACEGDGSYIIDIYGRCKSSKCGNIFRARGKKLSDKEGLIIRVNTRDTRSEVHDDVKRPLNGKRRKEAAQEMVHEGCVSWKRRKAREDLQYGDLEPAYFPNADVMRQAKKECIHADLNVKPGDSRDLIRTIENISGDPEYGDLIHAVGSLPFYTFYSTPAQLDAYKKYVRLNRLNNMICVDATGSLIRKLDRRDVTKTGHIFLYSIVVNFEGTTQPVHQMLSEKHETEFIEYWLKQWLRKGAPKPKVAVSDYSRALISALCLAFNNKRIKSYLDSMFAILENARGVIEKPATVIRIDVAHLIHMICRWKCFEKASQNCIKEFFVRCIALMVECESLTNFGIIFTLTCAVGIQQYEDTVLELPDVKTTKDARKKLEEYIARRGIEDKLKKHKERDDVDYTVGPFDFEISEDTSKLDDDTKAGNRLVKWVEQRRNQAETYVHVGSDPNAFYLPNFIERLHKLANEFPLWTGVAMPSGSPHATSSYVESYFNDIKHRVFATITPPVRVDLFLKKLARNIIGETNLFVSKIKKSEMKEAEQQKAESRKVQSGDEELKEVNMRHTELCIPVVEEGKSFENLSQSGPRENTDTSALQLPQLDFALEELTFTDNISGFLSTSAITDYVAFNDSDLLSAENWRGKALENKDVDDFGDLNENSAIAINRTNETHILDHSYAKLDTLQIPLDSSDILVVDELKDDVNDIVRPAKQEENNVNGAVLLVEELESDAGRKSCMDELEKSIDPDKLQFDSKTSNYLRDENPSNNNELDLIDSEALNEKATVLLSTEPEDNAEIPLNVLQTAKTSKYFRSYPEIRQRNLLTTTLKRPYLLPNGTHCTRGVVIDGDTLFIRHTCPFDALIHILMTGAIDNLQYAAFLKKSQNNTLKFVSGFLDSGVTQDVLKERVIILRKFYKPKVALETTNRVLSYTIDTWDTIRHIVDCTLASEPSIRTRERCSGCEGRTYSQPSISPNHNVIVRRGFNALQAALAFKSIVNGVKCGCSSTYTLCNEPNVHFLIDLDIRGPARTRKSADTPENLRPLSTSGMRCKLEDFPLTLDLTVKKEGRRKSNAIAKYSLAGVVGYTPGHYIAYCRRTSGHWQVYDDMAENIVGCSSNTEIEPHLAIYILQMSDEMW